MTSPTTLQPQPLPIPQDIRKELPDPLIPWGISSRLFESMQSQPKTAPFKKVQVLPTDKEWRFIWRYFHHDAPNNYHLKNVTLIHERHQQETFELNLSSQEREAPKFPATWKEEPRAAQRQTVMKRWQEATALFTPFQTREKDGRRRTWNSTKLLPLWHGTSKDIAHSIATSGFVYFGKTRLGTTSSDPTSTDEGLFGSGIYFTNSARYASDIYSQGHLFLAWVSMREPFPVVGDPNQLDMNALKAQGAYKHYNAHYVPVTSEDPTDPNCSMYYPTKPNQTPHCDEIVIFHKSQALPRFVVELTVALPIMPPDVPLFVNELIPHLYQVLRNPHVDRDQRLRNILNQELAVLLTLQEDDDLEEKHTELYGQISQLLDTEGKVVRTVRQQITGSKPAAPTPQLQTLQISPQTAEPKLPDIAFGKAEWEKYFGDVGAQPPLPPNIQEILNGPCPYFSGKKIKETHLLTLIPKTVNGKPLSLNILGELIKSPKGGHATKYQKYYYGSYTQKEHGSKSPSTSYWMLLTKDLIPSSRRKTYSEQCQLLNGSEQTPGVLEAAVSILMHHARTGEKLYPQLPSTYTRCQEQVNNNKWRVALGSFGASGLYVSDDDDDRYDGYGLGISRKFSSWS